MFNISKAGIILKRGSSCSKIATVSSAWRVLYQNHRHVHFHPALRQQQTRMSATTKRPSMKNPVLRSATKASTVSRSNTEICDIRLNIRKENVTAHYYLVLTKLQTTFVGEILLFIDKTVLNGIHYQKVPKGGL